MKNNNIYQHNSVSQKLEAKMRVLANFLIDRFLEDMNNNRLKIIIKSPTINLDGYENHGTR
jgi:hypothetical protein